MEKLEWYSLEELGNLEGVNLVKCYGMVNFVSSKHNCFDFVITDGTNEVEGVIFEEKQNQDLNWLPKIGSRVIVVGQPSKKELSRKEVVKIMARLFSEVPKEKEESILNKIKESCKKREASDQNQGVSSKTKRSIFKDLQAITLPVEIRSLILSCVWLTLDSNPDLSSYTFTMYTLQKNRLTKSYIQSKKLKEESIEYLPEFFNPELKYLVEHKIIEEKEMVDNQRIYKANRKTFTEMELRILGIINEKRSSGTNLSDLVLTLNRELGLLLEKNYIINDSFVQKMLKNFLEESKIYKNSDKLLFPNI